MDRRRCPAAGRGMAPAPPSRSRTSSQLSVPAPGPPPASAAEIAAQTRASLREVESELMALRGLAAEVAVRLASPDADGGSPAASTTRAHFSSVLSTASSTSVTAAQEAAEGRRTSAPVGARHRRKPPQPPRTHRELIASVAQEIQGLSQRCQTAIHNTVVLAEKLEALETVNAEYSVSSADPSARFGLPVLDRRGRSSQDHLRTLRVAKERAQENRALCRQARELTLRAVCNVCCDDNRPPSQFSSPPMQRCEDNEGSSGDKLWPTPSRGDADGYPPAPSMAPGSAVPPMPTPESRGGSAVEVWVAESIGILSTSPLAKRGPVEELRLDSPEGR
eukprot:gnl/TRDRNA2_/TRDRNA2_194029_c0_seq1.p1 gnl/TRDRNA2_/TRDRNA2_194029_c0~~gnl/TRDRNA2_/TRDRNA2_194029_c0_seq1.p1  ORF type:complete len:335 (+),score=47.74 gnl/TRDRNA2_/TRDRNA2_194029_c0_seq1:114-1118(+)